MRRREFLKLVAASGAGAVVFTGCERFDTDITTWGNGDPKREFLIQSPTFNPEDYAFGRDSWFATAYPGVSGGSGLIVRVFEGRAKKVEGNPDYPLNRGATMPQEQALLQDLYHPDRITSPLRRRGNKGSGDFDRISWDDALNELAGDVTNARGRANGMLLITGPVSGSMAAVIAQFASATMTRHVTLERQETVVLREAMRRVFGTDRLPTIDLARTRFLLSFSAEFLHDWISPVQFNQGYGAFRQGQETRGTYWHLGPQLSATAANADRWFPINPGMEGVVALSMAQVITSQGLAQGANAGAIFQGISLDQYAPEQVAQRVGLSADQIRELARRFAQERPAVAIAGSSAAAHTNGLFNLAAVYSLNYLVGSVNQNGGIWITPSGPAGNAVPISTVGVPYREWDAIAGNLGGTTSLVIINGCDPLHNLPAASPFHAALDRAKVVVVASVLDDTARRADLVLPGLTTLESWGVHVPDPGPGFPTVALQQPVVQPFVPGARAFGDVLIEMGRRAGTNPPWATYEDAVRATFGALQNAGGNITATNPKEFFVIGQSQGGWWNEGARSTGGPTAPASGVPASDPQFAGDTNEFRLHLLPYPTNSLGAGEYAHLPWMQALPDPITTVVWTSWVELNPHTADDLDVETGDIVRVTSPNGSIEVPVYVNPAAAPSVALIPMGQGHVGGTRYAEGRGENPLAIVAPQTEAVTGALAWAATRVKIEKLDRKMRIPKFEGIVPAYQLEEFPIIRTTRGDGGTH